MDISSKLRILLKLRNLTPAQLGRAAGLSRPTMSRIIMRGHIPSDESLNRTAVVLEVSPGYLRGGYTMPEHLTEDDILFIADFRNVSYKAGGLKRIQQDERPFYRICIVCGITVKEGKICL